MVQVRRGEVSDAESLLSVARRAISISASPWYTPEQLDNWSGAFSESSIRHAVEVSATFVAVADARVAGFSNLISSGDGRAELDLLFIDPDFAGQGLARSLVAAVESEAISRNHRVLWVDASIPAARVFEHLGYQVEHAYLKEFKGLVYENTWLSKRLSA